MLVSFHDQGDEDYRRFMDATRPRKMGGMDDDGVERLAREILLWEYENLYASDWEWEGLTDRLQDEYRARARRFIRAYETPEIQKNPLP